MLEVTREGGVIIARPGEAIQTGLSRETHLELRAQLCDLVAETASELHLDLSGTDSLDTSGLELVLATHNSLKRDGKILVLSNINISLRHLFSATGLDSLIAIITD